MISQETSASLNYHSFVRPIAVVILFLAVAVVPSVQAQIHGVPPSVTSFGPGRGPAPGVPASVTSLGPNGFDGGGQFVVVPNCCNPLFLSNPFPGQFRRHHHHHRGNSVVVYPVPVYTMPYYGDVASGAVDDSDGEDNGGPTVFDRRGPGPPDGLMNPRYAGGQAAAVPRAAERTQSANALPPADSTEEAASAETQAAGGSTPTVLVFKDGHKLDVTNYAIVGDVLYDLTPGHPRKVALSDLDLDATQKVNEDQGISFQVPAHASGS